jgi:ribonuclease BN (tRNA processing enzyme)
VKFRVLGCSGGELPDHRTTCFLVDGRLAIDAGALTSSLPLSKLLEVDDVVLTHSHFDHVKDVPLLADLLVGRRTTPVRVHASTECARTLRTNVFNGKLWPDFTRIPSARAPVLQLRPFSTSRAFLAGGVRFQPVPVRHPVESVGFVVSRGKSSFAISGDTGPTKRFWKLVNASPGLKAVLVEVSFPNQLQRLADLSGHLTPRTLASELAKLDRTDLPILLYHLKPAYVPRLRREVAALGLPGVRILEVGDRFTF